MSKSFPSLEAVWKGAILGGIANASLTAKSPAFAPFRQWIRNHYVMNGCDGTKGVITFAGGHWYREAPMVGVFFSVHSSRSPFLPTQQWNVEQGFRGASLFQNDLANQAALKFLQIEFREQLVQTVTTAIWDRNGQIEGADDWETVLTHGADLIAIESLGDTDVAFEQLQIDGGMSDEQVQFVRTLYLRKIAHPPARIVLSNSEADWLRAQSHNTEAFELCRGLFREMDIDVIQ